MLELGPTLELLDYNPRTADNQYCLKAVLCFVSTMEMHITVFLSFRPSLLLPCFFLSFLVYLSVFFFIFSLTLLSFPCLVSDLFLFYDSNCWSFLCQSFCCLCCVAAFLLLLCPSMLLFIMFFVFLMVSPLSLSLLPSLPPSLFVHPSVFLVMSDEHLKISMPKPCQCVGCEFPSPTVKLTGETGTASARILHRRPNVAGNESLIPPAIQ